MKLRTLAEFFSANPYRDWALILCLSLLLGVASAIVDARFFLTATGSATNVNSQVSTPEFDKEKLKQAVATLKEKEKSFSGR